MTDRSVARFVAPWPSDKGRRVHVKRGQLRFSNPSVPYDDVPGLDTEAVGGDADRHLLPNRARQHRSGD
jgi:hypothetical protein